MGIEKEPQEIDHTQIKSKEDLLKVDILDLKFIFHNLNASLEDALRDAQILSWALDIDYLLEKTSRIDKMFEDVIGLSDYIVLHENDILLSLPIAVNDTITSVNPPPLPMNEQFSNMLIELRKGLLFIHKSPFLDPFLCENIQVALDHQRSIYESLVHNKSKICRSPQT